MIEWWEGWDLNPQNSTFGVDTYSTFRHPPKATIIVVPKSVHRQGKQLVTAKPEAPERDLNPPFRYKGGALTQSAPGDISD